MLKKEKPFPSRIIYKGDNYKFLKDFKSNQFDGVVIDPPFNSKRDYSFFSDKHQWDDYGVAELEILSRLNHGAYLFIKNEPDSERRAFLTFMAIRLYHLRRVLMPHGILFMFCDDREVTGLRIICDHIFGSDNRVNHISYRRAGGRKQLTGEYQKLTRNHGYILSYRKTDAYRFGDVADTRIISNTELEEGDFHKDDTGWYRQSALIRYRKEGSYDFYGISKTWGYTREKMEEMLENGMIFYRENGNHITVADADHIRALVKSGRKISLQKKSYLRCIDGQHYDTLDDFWEDLPSEFHATRQNGNSGTKTTQIMERVLRFITKPDHEDRPTRILDCFLGSGTTALVASMTEFQYDWVGMEKMDGAVKAAQYGLLGYKSIIEPEDRPEKKKDESQAIFPGYEQFYPDRESIPIPETNEKAVLKKKPKSNPYSQLNVQTTVLEDLHEDHRGSHQGESVWEIRKELIRDDINGQRNPRSFSRTIAARKWMEQNYICNGCNIGLSWHQIEADHIVPFSDNGPSTEDNCQILCSGCNRRKGARSWEEFLEQRASLGIVIRDPHTESAIIREHLEQMDLIDLFQKG